MSVLYTDKWVDTASAPRPHGIGSNRLPALAAIINEHVEAAESTIRIGLEHAIVVGLALIEAKELVCHGEWLNWLQANCRRVGPRQAQTYMRLARRRHRVEAIKNAGTAHLTITAAEALVGRPRSEPPHGLPGQLDMLGAPEVLPPSPTITPASPLPAIGALIADLEQALAVIRGEERFRAIARTITTVIAFLAALDAACAAERR